MAAVTAAAMEQGTDAFVPNFKICRTPAAEASAAGTRIPIQTEGP
ncbi:hypothetical protein M2428_001571 [Arthrobacter sp. ES3-54]|jgi:hypothetical protein|nr:hypothetical protein [Arthrobacter sp. ES3-54]